MVRARGGGAGWPAAGGCALQGRAWQAAAPPLALPATRAGRPPVRPLTPRIPPACAGVPVEDRIRRAPTLIIVNEQGEEIGSGKGNSHSLWVLSRRLVRMLLKQQGSDELH